MKRILWVAALGAAVSVTSFGFGFEWVSDMTEWVKTELNTNEVIKNGVQLGKMFKQGDQILQNGMRMEGQLKMDANPLSVKNRLRGVWTNLDRQNVSNQAGETTGWEGAVNKGMNSATAWMNTAMQIERNPTLKPGSKLGVHTSNAEIENAAGERALQAMGTAATFQENMEVPLNNCEQVALSTDPNNNTIAANGNISNACQALANRMHQASLNLDIARLGIETANAKFSADQQAEYVNMLARNANTVAPMADPGQAVRSFRDR